MLNKSKGNMYGFVSHTWNAISGKCPHDCEYCLPANTMILMGDFSLKRIDEIKTGETVIGLNTASSGFNKFTKSQVTNTSVKEANTIYFNTTKGDLECTPEHMLYGSTENRKCNDWKQAKTFSPYQLLRYLGEPKTETINHKKGWITGFIDGDGCFFKFFANNHKNEYEGFEAVCTDKQLADFFILNCSVFDIVIKTGTKISSKRSFNGGKSNPLLFSRSKDDVQKLRGLYDSCVSSFNVNESLDFFEGYIGGLLDTDGSVSKTNQIRISQSKAANPDVWERLLFAIKKLNIKFNTEKTGICLNGGFPLRNRILFKSLPHHSIKSHNLIYNFSVKGLDKAEILSISQGTKQTVYNLETTTENYIANGFIVHNCYMKVFPQREPHLNEKALKDDLGKDNYIFVGSSCDMFAEKVPDEWIRKVLEHCRKFDNTYLFQTKNPERIWEFSNSLPIKTILATTVETNRDYEISKAPPVGKRLKWLMHFNCMYDTMITIEPIMDFDLNEFVDLIRDASPKWVNIGADSKNHHLPEPPKEKIEALITELRKFTEVRLKDNLKRLMKEAPVCHQSTTR